ncbi:MAG: flagellar hook-basal body complex protein [Aquabacterium sp.]
MSDILSVVVSALRADQTRLEQTSLNAANASTPGYRRSSIASLAFDQVMSAQSANTTESAGKPEWVPTQPALQKITDFTEGSLQQTGRPLDVAVEGKGFVSLTDGSRTWLTRTASLKIDEHGDMVGPRGLRVVGTQGNIRPGAEADLSISVAGQVMRGDEVLGQIKLVQPTDEALLNSDDGVLFEVAPGQVQDATFETGVVRAGFLEGSNTNHLKEMLGVMENVRHFESLIRLAQGYDEVLGKAIQKLGEV